MKRAEIIGHREQLQQLRRMEQSKRFPHAVLLAGPGGIGKMLAARDIAAALLCLAENDRPCGSCAGCRQLEYGTHPDLLVITPDGSSIKIEQIRKLQQEVMLAPYGGKRRVCLLDDVQLMTVAAANSLLKILEEPTGEVVFILLSSNRQMLLPTIISRCMVIDFKPLSSEELSEALRQRGYERAAAMAAARLSGGRMGPALDLLENEGLAVRNEGLAVLKNLAGADMAEVWRIAASWEKMERKEVLQLLGFIMYILRDVIMLAKDQPHSLLFNIDAVQELGELARIWRERQLLAAMGEAEQLRRALQGNASVKLSSEMFLIKIYDLVKEV